MLFIGYAKSPAFLPQQQLFGTGQQGVSEVQLESTAICISIGYGINNRSTGELVGTILNKISEIECFVVRQIAAVKVTLDGRCDALEFVS